MSSSFTSCSRLPACHPFQRNDFCEIFTTTVIMISCFVALGSILAMWPLHFSKLSPERKIQWLRYGITPIVTISFIVMGITLAGILYDMHRRGIPLNC